MLSEGRLLSEREILAALGGRPSEGADPGAESDEDGEDARPDLDRTTVEQALQQVGGNRAAAARLLGISPHALYRRLDDYALR
jgi:DNA-binding NtrC family response regulator